MRYHYERPKLYKATLGKTYFCDHPVYNACTLYYFCGKVLAVIQQYYDAETKHTFWGPIVDYLVNDICVHPSFLDVFNKYAEAATDDGLYFTISVRQLMWELRMKPLKRERWETMFDHRGI